MKNACGRQTSFFHIFFPISATAFPPSCASAVPLPNARIEPAAAELR
jgi:hypothetical protein